MFGSQEHKYLNCWVRIPRIPTGRNLVLKCNLSVMCGRWWSKQWLRHCVYLPLVPRFLHLLLAVLCRHPQECCWPRLLVFRAPYVCDAHSCACTPYAWLLSVLTQVETSQDTPSQTMFSPASSICYPVSIICVTLKHRIDFTHNT